MLSSCWLPATGFMRCSVHPAKVYSAFVFKLKEVDAWEGGSFDQQLRLCLRAEALRRFRPLHTWSGRVFQPSAKKQIMDTQLWVQTHWAVAAFALYLGLQERSRYQLLVAEP